MSVTISEFTERVAQASNWAVQPDQEFRNSVENGLSINRERYGYYLCPCREGWGEREKDRDVICPCDYAKQDIEEYGRCYCGLFVSADFVENNQQNSIPERRPDELFP